MKKLLVPACTFWIVMALSGCGSDSREALISLTVSELNKAADTMGTIKENVDKWNKESKEAEKNKLLKNAEENTKQLSEVAKKLQLIKGQTENLPPADKDQKDEYLKKYRERLGSAVERLNEKQTALNRSIADAEKTQKDAMKELKIKLQQAQGEFEVLTKR